VAGIEKVALEDGISIVHFDRSAGRRSSSLGREATERQVVAPLFLPLKCPSGSGQRGRVRATLEIDGTASQSVTSYAVSEPGV
jgi:hypothetical protein